MDKTKINIFKLITVCLLLAGLGSFGCEIAVPEAESTVPEAKVSTGEKVYSTSLKDVELTVVNYPVPTALQQLVNYAVILNGQTVNSGVDNNRMLTFAGKAGDYYEISLEYLAAQESDGIVFGTGYYYASGQLDPAGEFAPNFTFEFVAEPPDDYMLQIPQECTCVSGNCSPALMEVVCNDGSGAYVPVLHTDDPCWSLEMQDYPACAEIDYMALPEKVLMLGECSSFYVAQDTCMDWQSHDGFYLPPGHYRLIVKVSTSAHAATIALEIVEYGTWVSYGWLEAEVGQQISTLVLDFYLEQPLDRAKLSIHLGYQENLPGTEIYISEKTLSRWTDGEDSRTQPVIQPQVHVIPSSGTTGVTFDQSGCGFSPNGDAELHFRNPDGSLYEPLIKTADGSGCFYHEYTVHDGTPRGQLEYWATDIATGMQSNHVMYYVYDEEDDPAPLPDEDAPPIVTPPIK